MPPSSSSWSGPRWDSPTSEGRGLDGAGVDDDGGGAPPVITPSRPCDSNGAGCQLLVSDDDSGLRRMRRSGVWGKGRSDWVGRGWFTLWLTSQLPAEGSRLVQIGPAGCEFQRPDFKRVLRAAFGMDLIGTRLLSLLLLLLLLLRGARMHLDHWVGSNFSLCLTLSLLSERAAAVTLQLQSS